MSKRSLFLPCCSYISLAVIFLSCPTIVLARPTGLGTFTLPDASGKGSYTTATGSKGTYLITGSPISGYNGKSFLGGSNGLQIINNELQGDNSKDKDKFEYSITLTPENSNEIHNILITQAGYATSGNSEIARQKLVFEKANSSVGAIATIIANPSVNYYYNAMGDYFMGKKNADGTLASGTENTIISNPQLRVDTPLPASEDLSKKSSLYYYNILNLVGSGTASKFTPTLTGNEVRLKPNVSGVLPRNPTINNIFKDTGEPSSYVSLAAGTSIPNGGTYVSYGIENAVSDYLIKVNNARSVTLTYEGIMNGNIGVATNVVGETYNEWITFGVSNEPNYSFLGKVFNDNGGIDDSKADAQQVGGIYNNNDYFNGVLNASEKGIFGSTIQLINCSDNTKVYAQTTVDTNGNYRFDIAQSLLPINKVCLKESISPDTYPIATSPNIKQITLSPTTTTYAEQNFGRVILKNAPLVLEKLQFANKCNLANLVESTQNGVIYSKDPVTASNPNIAPMNCIAYKLIATNRANLAIDNVVIQDRLAQKGIGAALITSTLINNDKRLSVPTMPAVSFNDGLTDGKNGTVKTAAFSLAAKNARSFYFNTKYGTTQSP